MFIFACYCPQPSLWTVFYSFHAIMGLFLELPLFRPDMLIVAGFDKAFCFSDYTISSGILFLQWQRSEPFGLGCCFAAA